VDLELVIRQTVLDAFRTQVGPYLQPLLDQLNISDRRVEEEYLTTPEAALLLKVSPITMSIWRHQKRGPEFVVIGNGRGVRYKRSVLTAFLENNRGLVGRRGRPAKEPDTRTVATSGRITRPERWKSAVKKAEAA
jgi:hypothetical protein